MNGGAPHRTAIVTGASRGLGEVVARVLGDDGYALVLTARHEAPLREAAARLRARGVDARTVVGDVADAAHRRSLRELADRDGGLDVLVNNASELGPSPLPSLAELRLDELRRVLEVNAVAPLALVQALHAPLGRSGGLIVNITSDAARGGYPGWGGYGASKAALELVSLTLAHELSAEGIAVATVDPGDLRTAMHQRAFPGLDISDRPLPDVTEPFWRWLFRQPRTAVSGGTFRAQADRWELVA